LLLLVILCQSLNPTKLKLFWSSDISELLNLNLPLISQTYHYPALGSGFPQGIRLLLDSWKLWSGNLKQVFGFVSLLLWAAWAGTWDATYVHSLLHTKIWNWSLFEIHTF
jgi:hypothetical protein